MINLVIPLAGLGSRFQYTHKEPKPLIDVNGKPMIKAVINCIKPTQEHRFIFITNKAMDEKWEISKKLKKWEKNSVIVQLDHQTEGALCSVLTATKYFNNDDPMMISNCDQILNFDIGEFYDWANESMADGVIMTYLSQDPSHSYAKLNKEGLVIKCAEKIVISKHATVGLYWFKHGKDFVNAAAEKIGANDREPNGEFYNCPVYNRLIANGGQVRIWETDKGVYTIGTPETLRRYIETIKN